MNDVSKQSALAWLKRRYPQEWQASRADIQQAKQATQEVQRAFKTRFLSTAHKASDEK